MNGHRTPRHNNGGASLAVVKGRHRMFAQPFSSYYSCLALLVAGRFVLGCGSDGAEADERQRHHSRGGHHGPQPRPPLPRRPLARPRPRTAVQAYPLTVTDDNGTSVTVEATLCASSGRLRPAPNACSRSVGDRFCSEGDLAL